MVRRLALNPLSHTSPGFPRTFLFLFEAFLALGVCPVCPATSYHVMPLPSVSPQRGLDSADTSGQVKGGGGNVTVACHHVRPSGLVPGRQGVSQPPDGCGPKPQLCQWASKVAVRPLPPLGLGVGRGLDLPCGLRELLGCSSKRDHPNPFCPSPNSGETDYLPPPDLVRVFQFW